MSSLFGGGQTGQTAGQGSSAGTISTTAGQSSGNYAGGSRSSFWNSRAAQNLTSSLLSGREGAGPLSQFQQGPSQIERALGNRDTLKTALQVPQNSAQQIFAEAIQRARRI